MIFTVPQMTMVKASVDFQFKSARNRTITVKQGDEFLVTNTACNQQSSGLYQIARPRGAIVGCGHYFSYDQMDQFFSLRNHPRAVGVAMSKQGESVEVPTSS